jgi:DNA polymerase III subunit gamma/tau
MAEYLVSARKYRPTQFGDMVGQEHISGTLQNAIRNSQLAHSFLFCGPRGVGKTTAARILAKTINCEALTTDIEACGTCHSCISFTQNSSFNIHELDAASNNSVDDIRSLVEQMRFPPQTGKYKIYIIDEVHMLSTSAFNAFLKTLEEPPSFCKFILATTEKHKILPTILSRCQIFDFRRIPVDTIVAHLRHICQLEQIEAEDDALHIIAQKCDGGMRDALSMFDRLTSFAGGTLTYSSVLENLNVLDYDYFFRVTDAMLAQDVPALMGSLAEILKRGFEGDDFILGLCEHFRQLLFAREPETLRLIEVSDNLKARYLDQSRLTDRTFLINSLHIGNQCDVQYRLAKNKRLLVELTLLKMTYAKDTIEASIEASKKKLDTSLSQPKQTPETPANTAIQGSPTTSQPIPKPVPNKDTGLKKTAKFKSIDELEQEAPPLISIAVDTNQPLHTSPTDILQVLTTHTLTTLWLDYAETIRDTRGGAYALMHQCSPSLEGSTIHIQVDSGLQQQKLEPITASLRAFILARTGQTIELVIAVSQREDTGTKPYTHQDKLKRLIELHPELKRLQRDLGLDLDYD